MNISYIRTTKDKLNTVPLRHGQIIFITGSNVDDNGIYVDFLDTESNNVYRHPVTVYPDLTMQVDLATGHLQYQYTIS